jgi:hypothetical protein
MIPRFRPIVTAWVRSLAPSFESIFCRSIKVLRWLLHAVCSYHCSFALCFSIATSDVRFARRMSMLFTVNLFAGVVLQ